MWCLRSPAIRRPRATKIWRITFKSSCARRNAAPDLVAMVVDLDDLQGGGRPAMRSEKLPLVAAALVHTSRAAVGIAVGASLVMFVFIFAKLIGHPIDDMGLGDAALCIVILAPAVWLLCGVIALIADRMRGL
jgi:hypothetical protein